MKVYTNLGEGSGVLKFIVMLAFSNNLDISNFNHIKDNNGRIQLCTFVYNNQKFLVGNLYNNNIKAEQVESLKKLSKMIESLNPFEYEIVIGGDWNFIFDKNLDAFGGNPSLKLSSIAEVTKIRNKFQLCNIFRLRNPNKKQYTFRKPTPRMMRRLDYFLVSSSLQDNILKTDTLPAIESDHSPIMVEVGHLNQESRGPAFWKFPSYLVKDLNYVN